MVHSLFAASDNWDDQLEGFESGWPGFFEVLRVYLAHFSGKPAAAIRVAASRPGGDREAWSLLTRALNLAGANVGERREAPVVNLRIHLPTGRTEVVALLGILQRRPLNMYRGTNPNDHRGMGVPVAKFTA